MYICATTHGSRLILYVTTQSESRKYITLLNFKKSVGGGQKKDSQAPVVGGTMMNECVMGKGKRENVVQMEEKPS